MNLTEVTTIKRTEVRSVLRRHRGTIAAIARQLGITTTAVSLYLRGRSVSQRVADACTSKALELLQQEQRKDKAKRAA